HRPCDPGTAVAATLTPVLADSIRRDPHSQPRNQAGRDDAGHDRAALASAARLAAPSDTQLSRAVRARDGSAVAQFRVVVPAALPGASARKWAPRSRDT